ncbi:MAG: metal transporter [Acidobacteria bacterium]|nr:metal transporter [Acidobacteriota bacterium]
MGGPVPRGGTAHVTRRLLLALLPLALLAALVTVIIRSGPAESVRGEDYPPVERLTFQRVTLEPGFIVVNVLNDGPDAVSIAQVQVDEAYWTFTADNGVDLGHLGRTTLRIPYPWVGGEAHLVKVLSSTGTAFEREIPVAVETPTPNARFFGVFTLIGLYVGVIPVIIGLLWFPFLQRLSVRGMDFLLALTVGLLAFLLVDGANEGFESAELLPESFQGVVLFALAAGGAYLLLEGIGAWLRSRRRTAGEGQAGWVLAVLVAVGIGLHNFGEGLAIGSAFSLGEAALGTLLIVGFTLHNTTEGLAIVAPLAREQQRVSVADLAKLGLIGGVPTIAGAWLGGFVYSPVWSVLFLAIGVGAIAQVIGQIVRHMAREGSVARMLATGPVLAGLFAGFAVMYVTGMLVG